jgi:hypothetical protein
VTRLRFQWRWYDWWIGAFWDYRDKVLYICPLPTIVVRIYCGPRRVPR